ncbi:hypothetical protein ACTFIR_012792 [Dictyostelium discoideum]
MFGLSRSSDLVKWSFNGLIITPDSIKGPVINVKEQRKGVLSILELTSLDDTNSHLVKWSFNGLIITPDSIKGPVINVKEQRKGVLSILELTSLDDTNSQVCPVRHLSTYLRASKGRRKPHSGDAVFIQNEGKPLDDKEINIFVLSTLSNSGIDICKFKSHSTRSAMASLLLTE